MEIKETLKATVLVCVAMCFVIGAVSGGKKITRVYDRREVIAGLVISVIAAMSIIALFA